MTGKWCEVQFNSIAEAVAFNNGEEFMVQQVKMAIRSHDKHQSGCSCRVCRIINAVNGVALGNLDIEEYPGPPANVAGTIRELFDRMEDQMDGIQHIVNTTQMSERDSSNMNIAINIIKNAQTLMCATFERIDS